MKKISYVAIGMLLFLVSVCTTANAQKDGKAFSVGFGLEGGLPVGDANTIYNFTAGITIRFAYHVGPGYVTLTSGAVAFIPKSGQGKSTKASLQIPVKAGYKYIFYKPFFVMGELGYSSFRIYSAGSNNIASITSGGFTYAPTIGVTFNAIELGIKYEATSVSGGTFSNINLRLGFNF